MIPIRFLNRKLFSMLILLALVLSMSLAADKDLYRILNVRPSASANDIKQSYKRLVKDYHPDKNKSPDAQQKFIEIQQAYEILSDPEKKKKYDTYGTVDPQSQNAYHSYQGAADHFADMFAQFHFGGFQFNMPNENNFFTKHRISERIYEDGMIKQSYQKPFLIFVYATWCFSCMRMEPVWERLVSELEPIGYGIGTVNSAHESHLVDKLRVRQLPATIVLVEGRVVHYKQNFMDFKALIKFARESIPAHYVSSIFDYNYGYFLDKARRANKVGVLMFGRTEQPRLRYLLTAVKFHQFGSFGYVQLAVDDGELRRRYDVHYDQETLLIFNERQQKPVAILQMHEIPASLITSTLESYKFLSLPRISSQQHFDELCPENARRQKFCAILLVQDVDEDRIFVETFRDYAESKGGKYFSTSSASSASSGSSLRFVYVYEDKQKKFVASLITSPTDVVSRRRDHSRHVVVVGRTSQDKVRLSWLIDVWDVTDDERLNRSIETLEANLKRIISSPTGSSRTSTTGEFLTMDDATLNEIVDENGPGVYKRLATKLMRTVETVSHQLSKQEVLPVVSVIGTLFAIMIIGWCLNYVAENERKMEHETKYRSDRNKPLEQKEEFKTLVRELRAETYFGMVRLLKPGFRTLVVLCDEQSKNLLVKQFTHAVWPWRKNRTLLFGYLMVDKNLEWYKRLLEYTLPDVTQNLHINPKNVIGTVLALNGFRQYFCMYHPKHAPSLVGLKDKDEKRCRDFLGFGDRSDDSNSDNDNIDDDDRTGETKAAKKMLNKKLLKVDELLDGLPNWLDHLFEGSARRYHIHEWPQNMR